MFAIVSNALSSAFYGGFADMDWLGSVAQEAVGWLQAGFARVPDLVNGIIKGVGALAAAAKSGWDFFTGWFRDDPVAAVAGAGLVVAGGVLLFMGGTALGSVIGGISGLGLLKGLAFSAAAGALNAVLGNPIQKCIRWLVRSTQFIYNFNWNQTDEEIKKEQEASIESLYGVAGQTLGTALGSTICGVLPGVAAVRMNLGNVAAMWEIINDDIKSEVLQQFNVLCRSVQRVLAENLFKEIYINVRRWIKANDTVINFISSVFPNARNIINSWGAKESKPFSFALAVEERIERIKDPKTRKFVEGFVENAFESCGESLIAISAAF